MNQSLPDKPKMSARPWTFRSRLSISAAGSVFIGLLALAWTSAMLYLVVRTRLPVAINLAIVDTVHIYVGVASMAFFAALVATGRLPRIDAPGKPPWIGGSLLILYLALYATGAILLVPLGAGISRSVVTVHSLAAVWSVPPSAVYYWRARPNLHGLVGGSVQWVRSRYWLGLVIVLLPAVPLTAMPRAMSPLAQAGAGGVWTPSSLRGISLDRMAVSPQGGWLLAGGDGLFLGQAGQGWRRLDFPAELILGLAASPGPTEAYVGTEAGLYAARRVGGPYQKLPLPGREVHGIAVEPGQPSTIWASSRQGIWRSDDSGAHWVNASQGLRAPEASWALSYFQRGLYGSDALGVYRWTGAKWESGSQQKWVVSLDPSADGRRLFASSMGDGIQVFDGKRWHPADDGLASHGGGAIHVVSVTAGNERAIAATMLDGVAIRTDAQFWSGLGSGLSRGAVWRVLDDHGMLLAATDDGLFSYTLTGRSPAGTWWVLLAGVLVAGTVASLSQLRFADEAS